MRGLPFGHGLCLFVWAVSDTGAVGVWLLSRGVGHAMQWPGWPRRVGEKLDRVRDLRR